MGIKVQMVFTFEFLPCIIYWGVCISVSSWALGVSLRELPHDSGIAFQNSWKNERTIRHPGPASQLKKTERSPRNVSVSAFPPGERHQCGQVELVQLGRGGQRPLLGTEPVAPLSPGVPGTCLVRSPQSACNQPGGVSRSCRGGGTGLLEGSR